MTLSESLLDIKERIIKLKRDGMASSLTETETRRLLIDPLITALGYDVDDLDQVRLGWRGGKDVPEQKEADYALFLPGQLKPCVIVEAKRLSKQLEDEKIINQTLMYAFINGVAWCLVTNGNTIAVYDAFDRKKRDRSLFMPFDIEKLDSDEGITADKAELLLSLLTPDSIKTGQPKNYAESTQATTAVLDILQRCVSQHDRSLVRLIKKKLNREYTDEQIKTALGVLNITGDGEAVDGKPISGTKSPRSIKPDAKAGKRKRKKLTSKERHEAWKNSNTMVCPMRDDGFEEVFLGEKRWYAVRLRQKRIQHIKFIAAYRIRPISAITHYAEVSSIAPCGKKEIEECAQAGYNAVGKYIINLKGEPSEISPVHIPPIQGPIFINIDDILH